MKIKSSFIILLGAFSFLTDSIQTAEFAVHLGPFELQLDGGRAAPSPAFINDPICYAIRRRKLLELVMESKATSGNETKITVKKITIQPYLYGRTNDGQPALRGDVVAEKMLREISIKEGENTETEKKEKNKDKNDSSFFSGLFKSTANREQKANDIETVKINRIVNINVIEESSFDPPKDFNKIFTGDLAEIICTVAPQ